MAEITPNAVERALVQVGVMPRLQVVSPAGEMLILSDRMGGATFSIPQGMIVIIQWDRSGWWVWLGITRCKPGPRLVEAVLDYVAGG